MENYFTKIDNFDKKLQKKKKFFFPTKKIGENQKYRLWSKTYPKESSYLLLSAENESDKD